MLFKAIIQIIKKKDITKTVYMDYFFFVDRRNRDGFIAQFTLYSQTYPTQSLRVIPSCFMVIYTSFQFEYQISRINSIFTLVFVLSRHNDH